MDMPLKSNPSWELQSSQLPVRRMSVCMCCCHTDEWERETAAISLFPSVLWRHIGCWKMSCDFLLGQFPACVGSHRPIKVIVNLPMILSTYMTPLMFKVLHTLSHTCEDGSNLVKFAAELMSWELVAALQHVLNGREWFFVCFLF